MLHRILGASKNSAWTGVVLAAVIGLFLTVAWAVRGVLTVSLPYRAPGELVRIYGGFQAQPDRLSSVAVRDVRTWQNAVPSMALSAWQPSEGLGFMAESGRSVNAASVDAAFFDVLGVRPAVGGFSSGDFETGGGIRRALLAHNFWVSHFGGRKDVVGSQVDVLGSAFRVQVVGVLPRGFVFPSAGFSPDLILPLTERTAAEPRSRRGLSVVARVTGPLDRGALSSRLQQASIAELSDWPANAPRSLRPFDQPVVVPIGEEIGGKTSPAHAAVLALAAVILAGVLVGLVLLEAARLGRQSRDRRIKALLGATGWHLMKPEVVRLSLGLAGGVVGALLVLLQLQQIVIALVPAGALTGADVGLDRWTVGAAAWLGVFTLLVLVVPTALASTAAYRQHGIGRSLDGKKWLRTPLIVLQSCIAMVVVSLAITGARTVRELWLSGGLEVADRQVVEAGGPGRQGISESQRRDVLVALGELPGVESVGSIDDAFLRNQYRADISWRAPHGATALCLAGPKLSVTPALFSAAGLRLLSGRIPTAVDVANGPIAIVSESAAQECWPGESAVGKAFAVNGVSFSVAGVVGEGRLTAVDEETDVGEVYLLGHALPESVYVTFFMMMAPGQRVRASEVEAIFRRAGVETALRWTGTVSDRRWLAMRPQYVAALGAGIVAIAGVVVMVIALVGVVAIRTVERRSEMAVRVAIGASPLSIVRDSMVPECVRIIGGALVGAALTVAAAAWASTSGIAVGAVTPLGLCVAAGVVIVPSILAVAPAALLASRQSQRDIVRLWSTP